MCRNPGTDGDGSSLYPPPQTTPEDPTLGSGGCTQVPLPEVSGNNIQVPRDLSLQASQVTTVPDERPAGTLVQEKTLSYRVPYIPQPFLNRKELTQEVPAPWYFVNSIVPAQSVYLPIYIGGVDNIVKVTTSYYDEDGAVHENLLATEDTATGTSYCNVTRNPDKDLDPNTWCIQNNGYTGHYDVFHINGDQTPGGKTDWDYGGFTITFRSINTKQYVYEAGDPMTPGSLWSTIGMGGGNALYHTTKLGRLELLGIPQIFYEPLYCNTNRNELVAGIFDANPSTRDTFEDVDFSWQYESNVNDVELNEIYDPKFDTSNIDFSNEAELVTYQDKVSIPQIFSSNKFACCLNLGQVTDVAENCCSNFAAERTEDGKTTNKCALSRGANLHVYFNRFISGDGVGDKRPGGGLIDTDFIPLTGEPRVDDDVQKKIRALGEAYCASNKVRGGATFGNFFAQPNNGFFSHDPESGKMYSIIDNSLDSSGGGEAGEGNGYIRFQEGYRWSHHLYCAPE